MIGIIIFSEVNNQALTLPRGVKRSFKCTNLQLCETPLSSSELWECGKGNFFQPAILWCSSLPLDDIQRGGDLMSQKCSYLEWDSELLCFSKEHLCSMLQSIQWPLHRHFMIFDITEAVIFAFGVWIQFAHCTFHFSCFHAQGPTGPPGPQGADVSEVNLNKQRFLNAQIKERHTLLHIV